MELSSSIIAIIILSAALVITVSYFGWRIKTLKRRNDLKVLTYEEARSLARSMLNSRYHGERGFVAPYTAEFKFEFSIQTLRKALQETNPTPNRKYVQRVLDDLSPNTYQVLSPDESDRAVA